MTTYTELTLADRVQQLHNIIRELEQKHHALVWNICINEAAINLAGKGEAVAGLKQAVNNQRGEARTIERGLPALRLGLAKLEVELAVEQEASEQSESEDETPVLIHRNGRAKVGVTAETSGEAHPL